VSPYLAFIPIAAGHGGMFSETQFRGFKISFDTSSQALALFQGKYYVTGCCSDVTIYGQTTVSSCSLKSLKSFVFCDSHYVHDVPI
jgi:hypothetical protein